MYHADLVGALASYWIKSCGLVWNIRGSLPSIADLPFTTRVVIRACSSLSGKPDVVIVNSQQGQIDHQAIGYQPREWIVIHNGIDTQRFAPSPSARAAFRQRLGLEEADRLIGCVARFHSKKGHQVLIQSFARLFKKADDLYLVLVGQNLEASNAELMAWIQQAEVGERVFLLGPCERSEAIYPGLDLLAMPSTYGEGFPNVVAEAMSCGVPCVVTDVGDAALIVGDTGQVVAPDEIVELSEALFRMVDAVAENRGPMAERARDRIVTQFNVDRMVSKYEHLYQRLIHQDELA
jgi:glycosyltransferase involved in cell wall biosynthesis